MNEPLYAQPIAWRQRNSCVKPSRFRKIVLALLSAGALSGCSVLGVGEPDVTAGRPEQFEWGNARMAELEAEVARLQTRNAALERELAELRQKGAEIEPADQAAAKESEEAQPVATASAPPVKPETVIATADADNALADAPAKPVEPSPRLVQPTFASGQETVFENEANGAIEMSSVLYGVHLASYRHIDHARAGWAKLQRENPDELGLLEPRIEAVEIEGRGRFLRLIGGGFSSQEKAESLCAKLKAKGVFCAATGFNGERLPLAGGKGR